MAKQSGSQKPGGGMGSKAEAKTTVYHRGQPAQRTSEAAVSQIGSQMGNKAMDSSRVMPNPASPLDSGALVRSGQPPLGQEVAYSTVCGPGGSRTVKKSGGQGMHGAPAPGNPTPKRGNWE
jgi:hypothetical protein